MDLHKGKIHSIQSDIFEKRIVTASSDGVVRVFDNKAEAGSMPLLEINCELQGSYGVCTKAVFIKDGELIASSYFSGKLALWKREAGTYTLAIVKDIFNGTIYDIDAVYKNEIIKIYCACSDGTLRIVDIAPGYTFSQEDVVAHRFGVTCVSSNSEYVVTGGLDNSVVLWREKKEEMRFRDHSGFVRDVKISRDNVFGLMSFASCSEDGIVNIYTKTQEEFKKQSIEIKEPVYSLSWSKTGFSLSVGFGSNGLKCFSPGSDGKFTEVDLTKCEN
ncbi:Protein transport protein SEC13 [Nosema granulosis]|uniref:Protein transport protein SEC13 n=1 Tax=Nosema granulosis TaxID=83296 RepID=A0A9P6L0K9_9MICR|nr:Protein transport protein SEC13 [Nosema granulosis]